MPHTPGLWRHVSRPIAFTLFVDNFGIQYKGINMPNTSSVPSEPTTKLKWIGMEAYIVELK